MNIKIDGSDEAVYVMKLINLIIMLNQSYKIIEY